MVFCHAHHVDVVRLGSLGGMDRHEAYRIIRWRWLFGAQVELLQEMVQASVSSHSLRDADLEFLPCLAVVREIPVRVALGFCAEFLFAMVDESRVRVGATSEFFHEFANRAAFLVFTDGCRPRV